MRPRERRSKILDHEFKVQELKDSCPHESVSTNQGGDAVCVGCSKTIGSYCYDSPNKICEADPDVDMVWCSMDDKHVHICMYCKDEIHVGGCYYR